MQDPEIEDFVRGPAQHLPTGKRAAVERARQAQVQAWQAFPGDTQMHAILRLAVIEAIRAAKDFIRTRPASVVVPAETPAG